jgi:hypothetical protein
MRRMPTVILTGAGSAFSSGGTKLCNWSAKSARFAHCNKVAGHNTLGIVPYSVRISRTATSDDLVQT